MSDAATLVVELGVEELPAGSLLPMSDFLAMELSKELVDKGLASTKPKIYATPRRIAVSFDAVEAAQQDREIQRRGPAVAAAFDGEGAPTKALEGFAKSCGAAVDDLKKLETDKGSWMVYDLLEVGQSVASVLSAALPRIFKQMPMPKRMRWSDGSEEFLRPVKWLLALHGSTVVKADVLGSTADRNTYGHRFHSPGAIPLAHADEYEQSLRENHVIASFEERRDLIREQVLAAARAAGAEVIIDSQLLDEVTALVEWPVALSGSFEKEFLSVPKEALIQTMEENQRYFALLDNSGDLYPGFITVANIESSNPASVREGNERVIRPRFKDTMFFWENDKKRKFADFREGLKKVLFQEKLGTVYDKTVRLEALGLWIASEVGADATMCENAAKLCRCDLLTDTVSELAKMQGIAGRYFAEFENYPAEVCSAMEEQYWPKQAGGQLPETTTGVVLALAEKVDTLTGIYGIGLKPTGAKDPFGLRRASLGLLRILIERKLDLDLRVLIENSAKSFDGRLASDFDVGELVNYVLERLKGYYQDQGESGDVVDAVLATGSTNPLDIHYRIKAVAAFRKTEAALSLAAANKRIRNILKKVKDPLPTSVDEKLLTDPAEQLLAKSLASVEKEIEPFFNSGNYQDAMASTAKLRKPVDDFFNDVMVMVDDADTRTNRLALLKKVGNLCSRTADLSRLQIEVDT